MAENNNVSFSKLKVFVNYFVRAEYELISFSGLRPKNAVEAIDFIEFWFFENINTPKSSYYNFSSKNNRLTGPRRIS